jgi:S1-C subfamily serine protease
MQPSLSKSARVISALLALAVVAQHDLAQADELDPRALDQAVVRVIALGSVNLVEFSRDGTTIKLAAPLSGQGSGFLVSDDGLIVTAGHIVDNARHVAVMLAGSGETHPADVVSISADGRYAFLRIAGQFDTFLQFATSEDSLQPGQSLAVMGYSNDLDRLEPRWSPSILFSLGLEDTLQLAPSVDGASMGGPVLDAENRVRGVLVPRAGSGQSLAGDAWAVAVSAVREQMEQMETDSGPRGSQAPPASAEQRGVAELAALLMTEGNALVRSGMDLEAAATTDVAQDEVIDRTAALSQDAQAQLLAAAYFWNRYVLATLRHEPTAAELRARATTYAKAAVTLTPGLRTDSQLAHALLADAPSGTSERVPGWSVTGVAPTGSSRVTFQSLPGSGPVALYVRGSEEVLRAVATSTLDSGSWPPKRERCTAPCRTDVEGGVVEVGVGRPGHGPPERRIHTFTGPTLVRSYYKSRRGVRIAGSILGGATAVGGVVSLASGLGTSGCGGSLEKLLCPRGSLLALGIGLVSLGIGTFIFSMNQRDTLTINISPQVSTDSGGVEVGGSF